MKKSHKTSLLATLAVLAIAGVAAAEQITINGKVHTRGYCGNPQMSVVYVGALTQERADHLCACQHFPATPCSQADQAEARARALTAIPAKLDDKKK